MAENTSIAWADHTFNPWRGCQKVAEGCRNCYAEAQSNAIRRPSASGAARRAARRESWRLRSSGDRWRSGTARLVQTASGVGPQTRTARAEGTIAAHAVLSAQANLALAVFVGSLMDWAEDWTGPMVNAKGKTMHVDPNDGGWFPSDLRIGRSVMRMRDVRQRLFALIDACTNLDFLLLTKRPERIAECWDCPSCDRTGSLCACEDGFNQEFMRRENIWLLTSIANQADADRNLDELKKCRDLSPVLGASAEPLLEPVDFSKWLGQRWECPECGSDDENGKYLARTDQVYCGVCAGDTGRDVRLKKLGSILDLIIIGGESGPNARPYNIEWPRSIIRQCKAAHTAVFHKQVGTKPCAADNHGWPMRTMFRGSSARDGEPEQETFGSHVVDATQTPQG